MLGVLHRLQLVIWQATQVLLDRVDPVGHVQVLFTYWKEESGHMHTADVPCCTYVGGQAHDPLVTTNGALHVLQTLSF